MVFCCRNTNTKLMQLKTTVLKNKVIWSKSKGQRSFLKKFTQLNVHHFLWDFLEEKTRGPKYPGHLCNFSKNCFLVQRGQLRHFLWASPTLLGEQFTTTLNPFRTAFCSGWVGLGEHSTQHYLSYIFHGCFFLKLHNMDRLETNEGFQTESHRSFSWAQAGGKRKHSGLLRF